MASSGSSFSSTCRPRAANCTSQPCRGAGMTAAAHPVVKRQRLVLQAAERHREHQSKEVADVHSKQIQVHSSNLQQQQQQEFQQVLETVQQQSYMDLQQLREDHPQHRAFSASFLFWLAAQEKAASGQRKQQLGQLAGQLVLIKEQADAVASSRMLPPLASSLAYSNYSQWRASHSESDLPEVTPGISLTDLYRAAEREEAKLKQWQSPQRPSSSLDNFAAASGYGSFAADAMARVRARLAGFEDDDTLVQQQQHGQQHVGSSAAGQRAQPAGGDQEQVPATVNPAAERVLDELLLGCCCREERATVLPEAFMPPGLEVTATGQACSSAASGAVARVLTTPQRLQAAVAARIHLLQQQSQQQQQQQPIDDGQPKHVLPSGEDALQALQELQEDITEYDTHVYRRLSSRDIHGL